MDPIISFLINHWILSTTFVLLAVAFLFNEWRTRALGMKGISPQELVNYLNHSGAGLIDLRSPEGFTKGHILGAQNIPEKELSTRLNALSKFKTKPLILVCASGMDAPKLGSLLKKEGFTQLYYLAGGMSLWQSNGMPLVNK
jgi:rhodanese-related sulfurtransferase